MSLLEKESVRRAIVTSFFGGCTLAAALKRQC